MLCFEQAKTVPEASWKAGRVAADIALSKDLMLKLDAEKGVASNPLEAQAAKEPATEAAAEPATGKPQV